MGQVKEEELKKEDAKRDNEPRVRVPQRKIINTNIEKIIKAKEIQAYWAQYTNKGYY